MIIVMALSLIVGIGIIAYPAVKFVQKLSPQGSRLDEIGVTAAQAACCDVIEDAAVGGGDHRPDHGHISYTVSPPSSGPHYLTWAPFSRKFYTANDRPPMGNLVHNLEHGYTILWYNDTIAGDVNKVELIERMSDAFSRSKVHVGKFIAAPYSEKDGGDAWPAGKNIAFTHWGGGAPVTQKGYRQFCRDISGAVLRTFMDNYPAANSPEPNGD
ncbi:uncharacterized protein DUF3105 [Kribbella orskensis]|uniref:Uncharacterized protein DUF3105 n=1 Tax=Kribbella orskensis TaxID=2512216 RepID=A0ABY2BM61_9ACTN|nr:MULTISPECIES: DUF3105 domain-containing protein [Kribbella]TCN41620.1 uncharacterized protein DUF3105 [Kribbella sp. VKM Ac-2500]TCO25498.1 uncharacterized protein DUF3105 [Kribbella orskensis]